MVSYGLNYGISYGINYGISIFLVLLFYVSSDFFGGKSISNVFWFKKMAIINNLAKTLLTIVKITFAFGKLFLFL